MALLAGDLLPASFRGAPFAVEADDMGGGRRQALHLYPGRDTSWPEDMGRAPRTFRFRGFIVDGDVVFAGGPIQLQRALLVAAFEKRGPGALTHPTLGVLNVSITRFSVGQDLGASRKSLVEFECLESGKQSFPSLLTQGSGLLTAATLGKIALAADFVRGALLIAGSIGGKDAAARAVSRGADQVAAAGADATAVRNLAAQLPGNHGRFVGGATSGFVGTNSSPYAASATVADLVAAASAQRASIASASAGLAADAAMLSDAISAAAIATDIDLLVQALLGACANPSDAVRLLFTLASPAAGTDAAKATVVARQFRRSAGIALAQACGRYQPASYDDAFSLLARASALLDDIAIEAADAGDDRSFAAIRALRVQLVQDLRARGAVLAPIRTFEVPAPMPALMLAQRFYRDPSRADELIGEAKVINPLFMPISIQALAA